MNIFNKYIKEVLETLEDWTCQELSLPGVNWEIQPKNTFLMERDTAMELGGYPKESINLIIPSSNHYLKDGVYVIGDPSLLTGRETHISFGKIVLLETEEIPDEEWYDFTQAELMTDSRLRMKDVMVRQSPTSYNVNLRISKKAKKAGFDAAIMGEAIYHAFRQMDHVKGVAVILILGDSPLYKALLGSAEMVKEVTLTLNHIFDGINMDCGHCDVREVCNEVEGMRALHRKQKQAQQ